MASKWTKYVITAVHYDIQHNRIESVHVREYLGASLSDPVIYSRQQVLNSIDLGESFVTASLSSDGNTWQLGEDVRPYNGMWSRYLRTDSNQTEGDNLGSLPEF